MNDFDIRDLLNKELLLKIIKEETLYSKNIICPDCQSIEDDQYTCTSCWQQGGNAEINVHYLIKDAYQILFENKQPDTWSIDFIKNILNQSNLYFNLFDFDFKDDFPDYVFKEDSYIWISLQDIYWFLFEKEQTS